MTELRLEVDESRAKRNVKQQTEAGLPMEILMEDSAQHWQGFIQSLVDSNTQFFA